MGTKRFGTPGTFVWHDLMTTDLDTAKKYYTDLLGWTYHEMDMGDAGMYPLILVGEMGQGGMVRLSEDDGIPSHWMAYLCVDDVDARTERAQESGGQLHHGPMDIPDVGRFSVVSDPQGAAVSLFQGGDPEEEWPESLPTGLFCWDELLTPDPAASVAFYENLVGWNVEEVDMGEMGIYRLLKTGDKERGGMMQMPPDAEGPPAWLPYILVADTDATAEKVQELGGSIFVPPTDIPDVGRFTVTADPTGAAVAFMTSSKT